MLKFIARRVLTGAILLSVVSTVAFFLFALTAGDAAYAVLGVGSNESNVAAFRKEHGLDVPVLQQYFNWVSNALQGNLGQPYSFSQTVNDLVSTRLGVTINMLGISIILTAIISVALGVLAAVNGGFIDRVLQGVSLLGFAVPNYIVALGLVLVFAVQYKIFAATGWTDSDSGFIGYLQVATLPILAITFGGTASLSMQIRGAVKDALGLDYVRVLKTRGLSFRRIILKHVLRNVSGPALTILGMQTVGMLSGLVVIEGIFAIPGWGQLSRVASQNADVPALMGLIVVTALIVLILNLTIEIIAALLNPKVRLQ